MQGFRFSARHLKIYIYGCCHLHPGTAFLLFLILFVIVHSYCHRQLLVQYLEFLLSQGKVSSPPTFSSFRQNTLPRLSKPCDPQLPSLLIERTFPDRYIICVPLCRLNK